MQRTGGSLEATSPGPFTPSWSCTLQGIGGFRTPHPDNWKQGASGYWVLQTRTWSRPPGSARDRRPTTSASQNMVLAARGCPGVGGDSSSFGVQTRSSRTCRVSATSGRRLSAVTASAVNAPSAVTPPEKKHNNLLPAIRHREAGGRGVPRRMLGFVVQSPPSGRSVAVGENYNSQRRTRPMTARRQEIWTRRLPSSRRPRPPGRPVAIETGRYHQSVLEMHLGPLRVTLPAPELADYFARWGFSSVAGRSLLS